jgi:hypothetical protein
MRNKLRISTDLKQAVLGFIIVVLALAISACSNTVRNDNTHQEESGIELALDESYDQVRNGARLILAFDASSNTFKGHVENTTDGILKKVRVEVHLSNGVELGPTTPSDLDPGESMPVTLTTTSDDFDGWTAHPEVGESSNGEHSGESESESEGEHDREEGGSEHDG